MKTKTLSVLLWFILMFSGSELLACHLSSFELTQIELKLGGFRIHTALHVGRGRTGVTKGGDNDTRSISFGFFDHANQGIVLQSVTPTTLTGQMTGCSMPLSIFGPMGAPYNCDALAMYIDPGYYGQQPCFSYPFECVFNSVNCGPAGMDTYNIIFDVDHLPDSIKAYGVEGGANPLAGCYPNSDMRIEICQGGWGGIRQLQCIPTRTAIADQNCMGFMPNVAALTPFAVFCDPSIYLMQTVAPGTPIGPLGSSLSVSLYASDMSPMSATCTVTVTVVDGSPPSFTSCPGNFTVSPNSNCQFILGNYMGLPTLSDNCDPSPMVIGQIPSPGTVITGATLVSLIGQDNAGNRDTCSFQVSATDATPPSITCPGPQLFAVNNQCQFQMTDMRGLGIATDNCGVATITQVPSSGTMISGLGAHVAKLIVADFAGNRDSCTFTVTLQDVTPPNILCPSNSTLALNGACQAAFPSYTGLATWTDNCATSVTIVQSPPNGTLISGTGLTTVTLTADDGSGNNSTCSLLVTHVDATPPNIACPGNQTIVVPPLDCWTPVTWPLPSTFDNCGSVTLSSNFAPGDSFATGTSIVTYTATDASMNTASCGFSIVVTAAPLDSTITSAPDSACEGDPVTLTTLPGMSQYLWSNAFATPSITVTSSGWYWVDVTAPNTCTARDSFYLFMQPIPQPTIFQSGNQVCTDPFSAYQWYLNGVPIPGATQQCISLTTNGNYSVMVADPAGCTAIAGPMSLVGVGEPIAQQWTVYPVPSQDLIFIRFSPSTTLGASPALHTPAQVILYDLRGRAIRSWNLADLAEKVPLSLEGIAKGSYLLEINAEGFRGVRKVVRD